MSACLTRSVRFGVVAIASAALAVLDVRAGANAAADTIDAALGSITPRLVRGHVEFLSHDLLEGRDTGQRGFEIAREYVASQYRRIGLDAPNAGSFLQPFDLLVAGADQGSELRVGSEVVTAVEASFAPDWLGKQPVIRGTGVFAGHGLVTTGRDDYGGADVRGRIVFLLPGVPPEWAEDPARAPLGRLKIDAALSRGAAAVVMLSLEGAVPAGRAVALADGSTSSPRAAITIGTAASKRLLAAWEDRARDLTGTRTSSPRQVGEVTIVSKREIARSRSWNVVGAVRGSDSALRGESVVFTAHLDHVGVGEPDEQGDRIFNGTHDNALGIGKLLASAEAMARLAPKRTVVFVAAGAEERGLLGSHYYLTHPAYPSPIANINHDGGLEGPATDDVFAIGAEYSSLAQAVALAAQRSGMRVSEDLRPPFSPSQSLLFRSDHYPFLRAGIPAVYLMDGYAIAGDVERGRGQWTHYLASVNHRQRDNFDSAWTFESPVRMAAMSVRLAWDIASAQTRPRMNSNEWFPVERK